MQVVFARSQQLAGLGATPKLRHLTRKSGDILPPNRRQSRLCCSKSADPGAAASSTTANDVTSLSSQPSSSFSTGETLNLRGVEEQDVQQRDRDGAEDNVKDPVEYPYGVPFNKYTKQQKKNWVSKKTRRMREIKCTDEAKSMAKSYSQGSLEDKEIVEAPEDLLISVTKLIMKHLNITSGLNFVERVGNLGRVNDHMLAIALKAARRHENSLTMRDRVMAWIREDRPVGNAVADVLIRAMVEEGQLSESANMLRILEELDLGLRAFPYNFIIQGAFLEGNIAMAIKVFQWLLSSPTEPDSFSFRNVLWAIRGSAAKAHLYWVYKIFEESKMQMEKNVYFAFATCAANCGSVKLAEDIFFKFSTTEGVRFKGAKEINVLIDAYAKATAMPNLDMIVDLYDTHNVRMDKYSFGLLLTAAYRSKSSMATVDRILDVMAKRKIRLNHRSAASAVLGYLEAQMDTFAERFEKALKITREIKTQTCYHLLMSMASCEGHLAIALRVQKEMEMEGHTSNFKTFNTLYNGCLKSGMANQANKYFELREEYKDNKRYWVLNKPKVVKEGYDQWKIQKKWSERRASTQRTTQKLKPRLIDN